MAAMECRSSVIVRLHGQDRGLNAWYFCRYHRAVHDMPRSFRLKILRPKVGSLLVMLHLISSWKRCCVFVVEEYER